MRKFLRRLGPAGAMGAVILAVASGATLSIRLMVFALILAIFALAVSIDERRNNAKS